VFAIDASFFLDSAAIAQSVFIICGASLSRGLHQLLMAAAFACLIEHYQEKSGIILVVLVRTV